MKYKKANLTYISNEKREKLTTGITRATPFPLSITIPVKFMSSTALLTQDAARANTAWTDILSFSPSFQFIYVNKSYRNKQSEYHT